MMLPSTSGRGRGLWGRSSLLAAVAAGSLVACDANGGPLEPIAELPRALTASETGLIESNNAFALKIFGALSSEHAHENVFLSPLSVAMALGMTYNGADAETRAQMAEVLELEGMNIDEVNRSFRSLIDLLVGLDPRVELTLANSIWARLGVAFEPTFLDINRQYFDARVETLDFSRATAGETINQWVREATGGRIEDIVPPVIPTDVVMYLINAIYFKATWAQQFDKGETRDRSFRLADGSEKQVPTMTHESPGEFGLSGDDLVTAVDLPYGGGAFSMTVAVPKDGVTIEQVEAVLDGATWDRWVRGLTAGEAIVQMPKFTIEFGAALNNALRGLGMIDAFVPHVANFSRMRAANDLYITNVQHKAFVEVDEEGTEAAAATSVEVGVTCACGPPVIQVDRPFFFAIRERFSETILFMGKVVDPTLR